MMTGPTAFTFNLWFEPWIDLEGWDGRLVRQGIGEALRRAHEFRGIFTTSPLEWVGIQRLLTAILQDMLHPSGMEDLRRLWQAGKFAADAIEQFEKTFAERFDIFSVERPFLQSADIGLKPEKSTPVKSISYLSPDFPSGTGINHYQHVLEDEQFFCPACCGRGLAVIPAFATTGGATIKPSINGVPPLYVLPGGETLFDSLAASLVLPEFQAEICNQERDLAWWKQDGIVLRSSEVLSVGYVESLTFAARRVRLYPEATAEHCTRCGAQMSIGVQKITFEMGVSRPKDAPFWRDPFAAYFEREKGNKGAPIPLRPAAGKAIWREFGSLFLKAPAGQGDKNKRPSLRPRIVDQLCWMENEEAGPAVSSLTFRCVGMRTDMKAKIFEWVDSTFNVPLALLEESLAGLDIQDGLGFALECARKAADLFKQHVNDEKKKSERYARARSGLVDSFWAALASPFRALVADLAEIYAGEREQQREKSAAVLAKWYRQSINTGRDALDNALQQAGDDGHTLRIRFQCLGEYNKQSYGILKKKEGGTIA
jgi:CRISPR system Cascade subunit CasA